MPNAKSPLDVIPETRPQRLADLMKLAGCGQLGLSVQQALANAERARFVDDGDLVKPLTKLRSRHAGRLPKR